jgi:hypothetical protein
MKKITFLALFAIISVFTFAQERIAVFPFEVLDNVISVNESVQLYRNFSNHFTDMSVGILDVVPRQEVEKLFNLEARFQLSDFSARQKTAEMERVLNGSQILSGIIGKTGSRINISVSLYTYPELRQLPGGSNVFAANVDELFDKMPELVDTMKTRLTDSTGGRPNTGSEITPAISLYDQLVNAAGITTITVTQDTPFQGVVISKATSIVLRGDTAERTIFSINPPEKGSWRIIIEKGVTLTLENITLKSICVEIKSGGTLIMNNASAITGCNLNGVYVFGTFTMNGGSITNNAAGGIYVSGIFTMNNGRIANNKGQNGGGVNVFDGTFTMKNGRIENNQAEEDGGGVHVLSAEFYMQGGVIAGNRASRYGGGVYVSSKGRFYMLGGVIAGNMAGRVGGGVYNYGIFKMTGGTIYGSNGGSNANTDRGGGNALYDDTKLWTVEKDKTINRY